MATTAQAAVIPADTTPPALHMPSGVVGNATSPAGAIVGYSVWAVDNVSGLVPVACAPRSSSLFPIGDTIVVCSAKDAAGNVAQGSFTVRVKGAVEQIGDVKSVVTGLGSPSAALLSHILDRAALAAKAGDGSHACSELMTFGSAVYDLARFGQITLSQAKQLIDAATRIRAVLACS